MEKSTEHFLAGIIDYAGLFPPAELSLEEAMAEYYAYLKSDYNWMLSRFILPFNLLEEAVKTAGEKSPASKTLSLSITTPPSHSAQQFLETVKNVAEEILRVHENHPEKIETNILEIKLPKEIHAENDGDLIQKLIHETVAVFSKNPLLPNSVFFEVPGFEFDIDIGNRVIQAIANQNKKTQKNYAFSGFKIRCGGVEAFQFPPSEYLAKAITNARTAGIPLKFTAGLHHPLRMFHASVQTKMFGFFNVFGASMLSFAQNLSVQKILEILEDENPENFTFNDQQFSWKNLHVSLSEIQQLRNESVISFGSCSIAEPVEDLQELGLIE